MFANLAESVLCVKGVGTRVVFPDTEPHYVVAVKFAVSLGAEVTVLSTSKSKEADAKKLGLPPMQLYDLSNDAAEMNNLVNSQSEKVKSLLLLLEAQVRNGRCTPGEKLSNDREIKFLPDGVTLPGRG